VIAQSPERNRQADRLRASGSVRARLAALLVGLCATSLPPRAAAQESTLPTDATLARLIEQSLAVRPELARARSAVHAQEQQIPQADTLPDPMLQIGIQNDGFDSIQIGRMDTSFVSFMATQTFPWPGKLDLRGKVAELSATQAEQVVARVWLSTEADVRRTYLDLLLVRDRLALLDQLEGIAQKALGVAQARYEAGDGAQSDVLRAQLELNRLKQRRFALQGEARGRIQTLNRLRAHPLDEAIETSGGIRSLPAPAGFERHFSAEAALKRSPELAAARLGVVRAGSSVALAEKSYYPDLTVGAGVMLRGQLPAMWLVTLGGPLPIFSGSKQSRAVEENQAWVSVAQQDVASFEQVLRLRTEQRHTAFTTLLQTIDLYEHGLLVQSEATTESTLAQYEVGKVAFISVLEASTGFITDQQGYLESIAAAYRILIGEAEVNLNETPMPSAGPELGMPSGGSTSMETSTSKPATAVPRPAAAGGESSSM
jgi:outer membrane protein TolC